MDWLAIAFALELGVAPMDRMVMYDPLTVIAAEPVFYQEFAIRAYLWNTLFLGGSIQVQEWKCKEELNFWPYRAGFDLEAGLDFGLLEIGTRRYCTHPVMPFQPLFAMRPEWEAAYWQIYLRLEYDGRKEKKTKGRVR